MTRGREPYFPYVFAGLLVLSWLAGLAGAWGAGILLVLVALPTALDEMGRDDPLPASLFYYIPVRGGSLRLPKSGDDGGAHRAVDPARGARSTFHLRLWPLLLHPGFYGRWAVTSLILTFSTGMEMVGRAFLLDSATQPNPTTDRFVLAVATYAVAAGALGLLFLLTSGIERLRRRWAE